jgi:hypothetical protein
MCLHILIPRKMPEVLAFFRPVGKIVRGDMLVQGLVAYLALSVRLPRRMGTVSCPRRLEAPNGPKGRRKTAQGNPLGIQI